MAAFPRLGLGCMRLSTEPARDEALGVSMLHAAFEEGIGLLDTAAAYCFDDRERGHNERLIAQALASWRGDGRDIVVATKGGMTRPDGRWEPDGRAKSLAAHCEASCRALGVDRLDLYQLHAPDSRTSLATSVRALAALKRDGLIGAVGLCNVTVGQLEEARRIVEIDSVQVELSVWHDEHFLSGIADYCVEHRVPLIAYRPVGGPARRARTRSDPTLRRIADEHAAMPSEIAIAWLLHLSDVIVPIPGATTVDTVRSIARARAVTLTAADLDALEQLCPASRSLRHPQPRVAVASPRTDSEVVLIMGLPGAGKSTLAEELAASGYLRLNRDAVSGTLRDLVPELHAALAGGTRRIVLDNTYVSRKSRAEVIRAAATHGVRVRCVWIATTLEDAQTNAVSRIISRHRRLPDDAELKALRKRDASAFLPGVQFRYARELEPPDVSEGFSEVEVVPFERRVDPSFTNRAVLVWCDGVLLRSRSGRRTAIGVDDVDVWPTRAAVLRRYRDNGWRVLGLSWQPEIAEGVQTLDGARAVLGRLNELLGVDVDVELCPHPPGPPACWCRKPLPGLGVLFTHRHRLDPRQCIYVGAGPQDPGFARRLGFSFCEAEEFFADEAPR
jgi:aryl-alcohol dehydrogenase-like predicted oxidoreductase/predicted kinase/histidinol phosphatase-like enzyme